MAIFQVTTIPTVAAAPAVAARGGAATARGLEKAGFDRVLQDRQDSDAAADTPKPEKPAREQAANASPAAHAPGRVKVRQQHVKKENRSEAADDKGRDDDTSKVAASETPAARRPAGAPDAAKSDDSNPVAQEEEGTAPACTAGEQNPAVVVANPQAVLKVADAAEQSTALQDAPEQTPAQVQNVAAAADAAAADAAAGQGAQAADTATQSGTPMPKLSEPVKPAATGTAGEQKPPVQELKAEHKAPAKAAEPEQPKQQAAGSKGQAAGFVRSKQETVFVQQVAPAPQGSAQDVDTVTAQTAAVPEQPSAEATTAKQQDAVPATAGSATDATEAAQGAQAGGKGDKAPATAGKEQESGSVPKTETAASEGVSDKKEPRGIDAGHKQHHAAKDATADTAGSAKAPVEEISGTKSPSLADNVKSPAPQGEPGQNGSGDASGKGGQEQKAQGKQVDQMLTAALGGQAPATEAAPVENKPAGEKSALHESILAQVKEGVVTHDGKGNGQVSIRLNPGELGELKIQVRMEDNRVRVEVQADNRMVKDLLMSNLDSLKEALSGKNFTMEGFDVSTGGGFNNPLPEQRANAQQQQSLYRTARSSYADPGRSVGRVNYLTAEVNNLLDVRF